MSILRREFLKLASSGAAGAASTFMITGAQAYAAPLPGAGTNSIFDVRQHGAKGDGSSIDTTAINKAIDAASASGGGTVRFPAGTYASYSIHLKSNVALYLDQGSTILAASVPEGSRVGYDEPEPKQAWTRIRTTATITGTTA